MSIEYDDPKKLREHQEKRLFDPEEAKKLPDPKASNTFQPKRVKLPTVKEQHIFGTQRQKTCGQCKFFNHAGGQAKIKEQDFMGQLYEMQWKKEYLCDDPKNMALCDQSGETLVGLNTYACEHYKPSNPRRG